MLRLFLTAACLVAAVLPAHAQEVEVTTVRFNRLRPSTGANANWLEAAVALQVRPAPGSPRHMVSRVRVSLLLGYEVLASAGGERRVVHHRSEAECVALEAGRADVRFYLPPEIVRRDQVQEPRSWGVELSVGGRPLPAGRTAYASTLATAEQRRNFQTRGAADAAANDGILVPQYLSPFANDYPRSTPSFVRRETRQ
jgi:hypothetical protein